ncbi:MAG: hypothetical protein HQK53_08995 [Oligoflexia bacterium]|nr:hypothetical protein [Oligoflexia bacterium]
MVTHLFKISIGETIIRTTDKYPFFSVDKNDWVEAKDLRIGDRPITQNKIIVTITNIEDEYGHFPVYNLNVEKNHNYYVSNMGILVHNCRREAVESAGSAVRRFVGNEIGAIGSDVSRAGGRGVADGVVEGSGGLKLKLKRRYLSCHRGHAYAIFIQIIWA